MSFPFGWSLCLFAGLSLLLGTPATVQEGVEKTVEPAARAKNNAADGQARRATLHIDLREALALTLPEPKGELQAAPFQTPDGKSGWVLRIPGARPIATPAYADGMLFLGGGYGSHEFYAFDSDTGKIIWKIQTGDDGPTAAVVADGLVAFNTESCTLVIVDEKTGRVIWQEWLGDPLMSQPAIDKGVLYMAHPAFTGRPGDRNKRAEFHPSPASPGGSHRLLAAELRTGRHIWEQEISGDVLTAPVLSDGVVYFTTFDGTSYALNAADGNVVWVKATASTSAPVVLRGELYETRKVFDGRGTVEGISRVDAKNGRVRDQGLLAPSKADYLEKGRGGGVALSSKEITALDTAVGFAAAPAAAQLSLASENLGVSSVVGAWAYQGSRAALSKGQILNAQGNYINSVRASDGRQTWQAIVVGSQAPSASQVFSPPAIGRDYLYLAGAAGYLLALRQNDGSVGFFYSLQVPMTFQPALARGNVYAVTSDGRLICLRTGSPDADGWYEWGGNAQHNKVQ
jgi:Ca-activated chloride channel homolog